MIRVIYNPVAGTGAGSRIGRIRELLSASGTPFEIRETSGPGDAVLLAREAAHEGIPTVLAVGGDGTINETVNGLAGSGTRLAVVPHGTGNVFADEVGLPPTVEGCLALLRDEGETIGVRLGQAEDRYFLLLASAGFDAEVVERMNSRQKNTLGIGAYYLAGLRHLLREQPTLWMEFPGKERVEAQSVLVFRGKKYGGGFTMIPEGGLLTDTLHVIALRRAGRWPLVRFAFAAMRGKALSSPDVLHRETDMLFVRSRIPSAVQVDGDYLGPLPVRFRMTGVTLRVVVPKRYRNP
ncbi:MAG: diacylglycerol kinase [Deltaproteobacteria bacterium]